jgi:hypothetical protein
MIFSRDSDTHPQRQAEGDTVKQTVLANLEKLYASLKSSLLGTD